MKMPPCPHLNFKPPKRILAVASLGLHIYSLIFSSPAFPFSLVKMENKKEA